MQCNEIMTRKTESLTINDTIHRAAEQMRDLDIGFMPVCDDEEKVVGVLTDRDIATRLVASQRSMETPVRDIMTAAVVLCKTSDDVHVAEKLMQEHQISRLVCVDQNDKLSGIIGVADLARRENASLLQDTVKQVKADQAHPTMQ